MCILRAVGIITPNGYQIYWKISSKRWRNKKMHAAET